MLAHRKRGMRSEKSEYKLQVQEMKRYRELLKERVRYHRGIVIAHSVLMNVLLR